MEHLLGSFAITNWCSKQRSYFAIASDAIFGITFDRERVLAGAALHDAGKIVHPDEMNNPGHEHEHRRAIPPRVIDSRVDCHLPTNYVRQVGSWEEYEAHQAAIEARRVEAESAAEKLLEQLPVAWPPHPLDPSTRDWNDENSGDSFRDGVRGLSWTEIPDGFLRQQYGMLSYLRGEVFREVLPAWIASSLREDSQVTSWLIYQLSPTTSPDRFEARFSELTPAQREVIVHTLEVLEMRYAGKPYAAEIEAIRKNHWRAS